ncbi:transcriptional regulator with XRE-family HTH domain [Variovorax boronicumulans]|uniref:hypothetical protein n=1 Tax=Variovorax boronicumulans TaxID=436515 RepID=UPI00278B26C5|nr:hypothetical protein [Variovorax boronicumulans]MDQ0035870.1 transcriptional regulator with XRE-family HTH domain [Variovorax boronicumulans]
MLTGRALGAAIRDAIEKKGVTQREVARVFEVKPPSVQDWMKKGTVSKDKLPALWKYFDDVVGPEHWGLDSFPRWPARPRTSVPVSGEVDAEQSFVPSIPSGSTSVHEAVARFDEAVQALSADRLEELQGVMDLYLKKPAVYRRFKDDIERLLSGESPQKTGTHGR